MRTISVSEGRQNFYALVSAVARGKTVTITRWGRAVAKISPARKHGEGCLPDLSDFRAALTKRKWKFATIEELRHQERY